MSAPRTYRPQPDALRALAITIVMVHHWRKGGLPVAGYAVGLFFALSGFFVTQGLLRLRAEYEGGASPGACLKKYYTRRWLRLLPAYWLVLAGACIAGVEYAREWWWAHALFLTNLAMLWTDEWFGRFSHFWALAAMEQFYLVWPLVFIITPRARTTWLIVGTMTIGPSYRLLCDAMGWGGFAWTMVPLAWMDALAGGALVAWMQAEKKEQLVERIGLAGAGIFLAVKLAAALGWPAVDDAIWTNLWISIAFLWLVAGAWRGFGGPGRVLNWKPLCWIGTISYGMYLLHNFTGLLLPRGGWLEKIQDHNEQVFVLYPCTVLLAWLLWRVIEEPIARFRRR